MLGNQCIFFLMLAIIIAYNLIIMHIPFSQRHIGPDKEQIKEMLAYLGFSSFNEFINKIIPKNILSNFSDKYFDSISEIKALVELKKLGKSKKFFHLILAKGIIIHTHLE